MTTRKPKLRFLSALLAVAMLLTLLPTAAVAEGENASGSLTPITTLNIVNNLPEGEGSEAEGWTYKNSTLTICKGFEIDLSGKTLDCAVTNEGSIINGTIKNAATNTGSFNGTMFDNTGKVFKNLENGKADGCTFHIWVENGSTSIVGKSTVSNSELQFGGHNYGIFNNCKVNTRGVTNHAGASIYDCQFDYDFNNEGKIYSGTFTRSIANTGDSAEILGGAFTGKVTNSAIISGGTFTSLVRKDGDSITGGIFVNDPDVEGQRKITVSESTINGAISATTNKPAIAYIIGEQTFTVTTKAWKFKNWNATGIDVTKCESVNDGHTVTLTIDLSKVDAEDEITLGRIIEPTDLILDDNDLPKELDEQGNRYTGSPEDGWKYVETKNTTTGLTKRSLTLYNGYSINWAGREIDWTINNDGDGDTGIGGIIEDGTFTGSVSNANTIIDGRFAGTVSNYATIENGTYLNAVTNYGTVKNGTYAGRFVNSTRTTTDADGNTIYADGIVVNGVFSRYADFGNQAEVMPINGENGFNVLWIKLGDATVNGCITEQAGIVGAENIVVTANNEKSFDHWSVSGDVDLTEIQKQLVGHEKDAALHLTLSGTEGGMILLTAETNALPGVLTAKDFVFKAPADLTADGTAKNAAVTTEKTGVGEIALHYYDAEGNLLAKAPTKAGTYTVTIDVAGTDKYEATTLSDPDWSFTVAEKTYNVTVVNGVSAMTTAAAGAKVTVKANAAPAGQKFSKWVSDSEKVLFVEKTDAETSFIMPEGDVTITAAYEKLPEEPEPEVKSYMLHVFDGETEVEGVLVSEAKAGETVTVRLLRNAIPGGQMFDHWEALPETLELKDASAAETTFVMPEEAVTLRAVYRDIVVAPAKPSTASVVAATAVIGTGVVLAGWTAYNIGTELYAKWVLPAGAEMPATRGELAALLWQEAGSPEPADAVETMTDAEKAAQWAVESGLMTESRDAGFAPEKKVGRLEVFMTLKKAETLKK